MHEQQNKHATLERNQAVVISEYPIPEKKMHLYSVFVAIHKETFQTHL